MAPLTQLRASPDDFIPSLLAREYYSQLAGAGLIIVGETQISCLGQGYPLTPGIYSDKQTTGWKDIIKAVHEKVRINIKRHLSMLLCTYLYTDTSSISHHVFYTKLLREEQKNCYAIMVKINIQPSFVYFSMHVHIC